ncbi:hypothetical protein MMC30_002530 [Trapelia coarctata]|nr:hypothetical protein [Trapelia coarctata]
MVFNTLTVGAAVAPTVVKSSFSHFFDREPRQQKPTAHISYDAGLSLIRKFIEYGSSHTVEELQAFTSQWVPVKPIVRVEEVTIGKASLTTAAAYIRNHLGQTGVDQIGGGSWWEWRRGEKSVKAEWIEMRRDYKQRLAGKQQGNRIMLYVHGGAYYFGSVDEHRYQMQRHARKLKARVLARAYILRTLYLPDAARYRLAPQFPFPCGLLDCLATYLYLLNTHNPSEVILAGDSAGAGMIVSMLIILRDRGVRMPTGAVLISPWVDLTHSFPSVSGDSKFDYIPAHGFIHKPSLAWPPANKEEKVKIGLESAKEQARRESVGRNGTKREVDEAIDNAVRSYSLGANPQNSNSMENDGNATGTEGADDISRSIIPGPDRELAVIIDGAYVPVEDQIQMYTTNRLISHPLVSPVLQPSLGGLPPLLILTGGGELLRDEQIYLAHKAANPSLYPPPAAYLNEHPQAREEISRWNPTNVQLQVWDDLCHVAPTLSFTRPAKHMYRSIAQFGAWALARAQKTEIDIMHDDRISVVSSESDETEKELSVQAQEVRNVKLRRTASTERVGKAGDALPRFQNHMIRQRVDRHGNIYALDPPTTFPALQISPNEIGVINPGLVRKWLQAKEEWDRKYAKEIQKIHKQRIKDALQAYQDPNHKEEPPPSALASRRALRLAMPKEKKKGKSWGMSWWTSWGSRHDKETVEREKQDAIQKEEDREKMNVRGGAGDEISDPETSDSETPLSRTGRHRRKFTDIEQPRGSDQNMANAAHSQASSDSIDDSTLLSRILRERQLEVALSDGTAGNLVTDVEQTNGLDGDIASVTNPQAPPESSDDIGVIARGLLAQLPVPGTARHLVTDNSQPTMPSSAIHGYDITAESAAPSLTRLDAGFGHRTVERSLPGAPPGPGFSVLLAVQPVNGEDLGLQTTIDPRLLTIVDSGLPTGGNASKVLSDVHYFPIRYRNNPREALAIALAELRFDDEVIAEALEGFNTPVDENALTDVTANLEMRVGDRGQLVISHIPADPNFSAPIDDNANDEDASETLTNAIANLRLRVGDNNQLVTAHALGNQDLSIRPNNHRGVSEVSSTPSRFKTIDTPPGTAIPRGPNSTVSSGIAGVPPNPFDEARAREARARHPKRKFCPSLAGVAGSAAHVRKAAVRPVPPNSEIGSPINPLLSQPVLEPQPGEARRRLSSFALGEAALEGPVTIHGPSGIPVIYESVSGSASECDGKGKAKAKGNRLKRVTRWAIKLSAKDVMDIPEPHEIPEMNTEVLMDPKDSMKSKIKEENLKRRQRRREARALRYQQKREAMVQALAQVRQEVEAEGSGGQTHREGQQPCARAAVAILLAQVQAGLQAEIEGAQRDQRARHTTARLLAQAQAKVLGEEFGGQMQGEWQHPGAWEAVVQTLAQVQAELQEDLHAEGQAALLARVEAERERARRERVEKERVERERAGREGRAREAMARVLAIVHTDRPQAQTHGAENPEGGSDGGVPVGTTSENAQFLVDLARGAGPMSEDSSLGVTSHARAPASGGNSTGELGRLRAEQEVQGGLGKEKDAMSM